MESLCSNYMKRQFPYIVLNTDVPPPAVTSLFVFLHHASYSCATVHAGGHSRLRDLAWLVNSWWTVAKLLIINVRRKRISCTSHLQHHWIQQGYLYRTKAKVICVYFLRIKLVVKLVFKVKSAVDILSPHIYDYRFGPSSPITQNLAPEDDLLAWSILLFELPFNIKNGVRFIYTKFMSNHLHKNTFHKVQDNDFLILLDLLVESGRLL